MQINQLIGNLTQEKSGLISMLFIPFQVINSCIDFIYPKKSNVIICGSNTGEFFSGSPKAFYEFIVKNHPEFKIYHYHPFKDQDSFREVFVYMLKFAPIYYSARYLVSSHPPNDFFPFVWWSRRKIFFNTWHGFGLKGIFFADSGDTDHNRKSVLKLNQKTDFFLVSSKIESATMTKCFLIDPNKFLYIGQPRNDSLVKGSSENYLNRLFKTIPEYQKIILYAPTYRRNNSVKMFPFTDFEITKFKKFLEQEKMIFLVRGHYYSTTSEEKISDDRIFNLSHEVVEDVYDILSQVDILITDYSSIYTDFLLLDRPMIFLPYDLDDYERKRGLLLDDFDFWTPGSKPSNYDEFIQELTKLNKNTDEYSVKRKLIKKIFHPNQEGKSCEQLYEIIKKDIR